MKVKLIDMSKQKKNVQNKKRVLHQKNKRNRNTLKNVRYY